MLRASSSSFAISIAALASVAPAGDVDFAIQAMSCRWEQVETLDVLISVKDRPGVDYNRYAEKKEYVMKRLAEAAGLDTSDYESLPEGETISHSLRYRYDRAQGELTEYFDQEGSVVSSQFFDGENWKTLRGINGSIHASTLDSEALELLGFDVRVESELWPSRETRFLHGLVRQAVHIGQVRSISNRRLAIFHDSDSPKLAEAGVKQFYVMNFDISHGFALREMHVEGYLDAPVDGQEVRPRTWREFSWEFTDHGAVSLPSKLVIDDYRTVAEPLDSPQRVENAATSEVKGPKSEHFLVATIEVDFKINSLNTGLPSFGFQFPNGSIVHDEIKQTAFQVGEQNPVVTESIARQFGSSRIAFGGKTYLAFGFFVATALIAVATILMLISKKRQQ